MKKRAEKLLTIVKLSTYREHQAAQQLALAQRRVTESKRILSELQRFCAEYKNKFHRVITEGITTTELQEFNQFILQLNHGIEMQQYKIKQEEKIVEHCRIIWLDTNQYKKNIEKIFQKFSKVDQLHLERMVQKELDDRAQRGTHHGFEK